MRKTLSLLIVVALTASSIVGFLPVKAGSHTITVPGDYPTIRTAIGNATSGDTILVKKGTYVENVYVNKPLSLIGEDSQKTVIKGVYSRFGGSTNNVIHVTADDVTISSLTITGNAVGILVEDYEHVPKRCKIINNNIVNNYNGGIHTQEDTTVTEIVKPSNLIISGNNITGNGDYGIIVYAPNNVISGNNITENGYATYYNGTYYGGTGISAYSGKLTISNNNISNNTNGLELGIGPFDVYGNNITDNQGYGVQFADSCNNTPIHDNNITRNGIGIDLKNFATEGRTVGSGNSVYRNNVVNNVQQAVINKKWAYDIRDNSPSSNGTDIVSWDYNNEGNYWSDYQSRYPNVTEINASGIGNTPYLIDENNRDRFPLLLPVDISVTPKETEPFPIAPVAIASTVVAVAVGAGLLFYFKKRKR